MSLARERNKDPGSQQCQIWRQTEAPPEKPPADIPDRIAIQCDSGKFLLHKKRFKSAGVPLSILSFEDWEPEEFAAFHAILLRSISRHPSAYVRSEDRFVSGDVDDARDFLMAAGWNSADAARICPDGWAAVIRN